MTAKAKHVGMGAGLFGGASIVALFAIGALIATAVMALSLVVPGGLAALIVSVVSRQTIDSARRDIETVKGRTTP